MARAVAVLVALVALVGAGAAQAAGRASYGGAAQAALPGPLVAIDPLSPAPADAEVAAVVFDPLFRLGPDGRVHPHVALASEPVEPSRARVRIRTDIRLHDGALLKAADVVASLRRALADPGGWTLGPIRAARAVADDTIELDLARPAPDLPQLLATPAASVIAGGALGARPVGSGPFAVESTALGGVSLVAHAAAFAGRPYLDALKLGPFGSRVEETQRFEAGALQVARELGPPASRRLGAAVAGPATLTTFVAIGRRADEPTAAALRAAIVAGVDRERLRRLARDTARVLPGARPDLAAARAAVERLPAGRRITLLADAQRDGDRPLAERLLADLSRIGLDVAIEAVDRATYHRRLRAGDFALALGTASPPVPLPGWAELALLAAVDPPAARAALARAPAGGPVELSRVVPLLERAPRAWPQPGVRGVALDGAGRVGWADVWLQNAAR